MSSPESSQTGTGNDVVPTNLSQNPRHQGEQTRPESPESSNDTIEDFLAKPFPKLDRNEFLAQSEKDFQKDASFEAEFAKQLMALLLETRAWAMSRPQFETERQGLQLLEEVKKIETAEVDQDRTRLGLLQFVRNIKSALAVLSGVGSQS